MMNFFFYTCRQLYTDMPGAILNNIRAFVRNQSASSLMQMMQNSHSIDIAFQEAEPILNIMDMDNPTIHHSQDSNQIVSNKIIIQIKTQSKIKLSHTQQMIHKIHKHE